MISTLCALALAASGGADGWLAIDRDISVLAAQATGASAGPNGLTVNGFVRSRYANSGDVTVDPGVSNNDLGGFSFDNARLDFRGSVGDFVMHIALEGSSSAPDTPATYGSGGGSWAMFGDVDSVGGVGVLDANATWRYSDALLVTAGLFLVPFSSNSAIREDRMQFLNHTVSGEHWRFRDIGVMVHGEHDRFGWQAAVSNGLDAQGEELALFARGYVNLLDGPPPPSEGSLDAGEGQHLRIAAAWYSDDDNTPDDTAWTVDATYLHGPFSTAVEIVDYDKGATSFYTNNTQAQSLIAGDRTAWAVQGGWLFDPRWEAALRYEDIDDSDDTTVITVGVNHYLTGHAAKLQLNYSTSDSDDTLLEADILSLGLTVSI